MNVTFYGVRGSWPRSGMNYLKGGHTVCMGIESQNKHYLFDAGTGLIHFEEQARKNHITHATLFISHYHLDHILGLSILQPLLETHLRLTIYAPYLNEFQPEFIFERLIQPPYYPYTFDFFKKNIVIKPFKVGDTLDIDHVRVETMPLHHPGSSCGYKMIHQKKTLCYVTDVGPFNKESRYPESLHHFIYNADLLVHDTSFTPEDYDVYHHFGHYSYDIVCLAAERAQVKRLALYHHNPYYDDKTLQKIEESAKTMFEGSFLAYENQCVDI